MNALHARGVVQETQRQAGVLVEHPGREVEARDFVEAVQQLRPHRLGRERGRLAEGLEAEAEEPVGPHADDAVLDAGPEDAGHEGAGLLAVAPVQVRQRRPAPLEELPGRADRAGVVLGERGEERGLVPVALVRHRDRPADEGAEGLGEAVEVVREPREQLRPLVAALEVGRPAHLDLVHPLAHHAPGERLPERRVDLLPVIGEEGVDGPCRQVVQRELRSDLPVPRADHREEPAAVEPRVVVHPGLGRRAPAGDVARDPPWPA